MLTSLATASRCCLKNEPPVPDRGLYHGQSFGRLGNSEYEYPWLLKAESREVPNTLAWSETLIESGPDAMLSARPT
jgi:hypothetical protein